MDLPNEIIDLSVKRLHCAEDIVRCGAVCKVWQSIVAEIRKSDSCPLRFSPWLMLSPPDDDNQQTPLFQKFFNFGNNKLVNIEVPHTKGRKCWGTPFGYIFTIGLDLNIQLFNPLSQVQLSVPSLFTLEHQYPVTDTPYFETPYSLRDSFIHKLILSSSPSDSSVQVMTIYGEVGHLAFAKPGDATWTSVCRPETAKTCADAIFFRGQFYVVTKEGELMICDTTNINNPSATYFSSPPEGSENSYDFFLVEMGGDLIMIERNYRTILEDNSIFHYETNEFFVHKLDFHSRSWIYLETLGDYALFLGNNTSFAISTVEYPNFKRNCIYFSDNHGLCSVTSFCDMGVYDYEQVTVDLNLYVGDDVLTSFARPLFFIPSF